MNSKNEKQMANAVGAICGRPNFVGKTEKGITLIALVITIIVLLILAGVTINMVLGDEGIINQTIVAKESTNNAKEKEEQDLEDVEREMENYTISDSAIIKNVTKNIEYSSIKEAINNSEDNDIIEIASGEYDLIGNDLLNKGAIIEIDKSITIRAADANNKPILLLANSDGSTVNAIIKGVEIKADNVCIENIILKVADGKASSGNMIQISPKDNSSTDFYQSITIDGCEFYGSDHSIEMYVKNANIKNCIFDESTAVDQGNIMVVKGTTGVLNVINNIFIGSSQKKHGISFYAGTNSYIEGNILIENNTFNQVYKAIVHESTMTYDNVSVEIKNNTFNNYKKKAVAIDKGSFIEYSIIGNVFNIPSEGTVIIDNGTDFMVDANYNYWGTTEPNKSEIFEGSVNATTYYINADKSNLNDWQN